MASVLSLENPLALAVAVQGLRAPPALPFRDALASVTRKIAGAARVARPRLLAEVGPWLRFGPPALDAFHPESMPAGAPPAADFSATVQCFAEALPAGRSVRIDYRSPYAGQPAALQLDPAGGIAEGGL
jgi:hypothetical protein